MTGSRLHPRERCRCPACAVAAAVLLLERGKPAMALAILRDLPDVIVEALGQAYARGHNDVALARRRTPRKPPAPTPRPAFLDVAAELRGHVERLGAGRVAEVLGVDLDDLGPLLEGRVGVARTALARVRRARP